MSWDKPTAGALIEVQEVGTKLFGGGALSSKEKEREEEEVMMRCITRSIMLKEGLHHDRAGDLESATEGRVGGGMARDDIARTTGPFDDCMIFREVAHQD